MLFVDGDDSNIWDEVLYMFVLVLTKHIEPMKNVYVGGSAKVDMETIYQMTQFLIMQRWLAIWHFISNRRCTRQLPSAISLRGPNEIRCDELMNDVSARKRAKKCVEEVICFEEAHNSLERQ